MSYLEVVEEGEDLEPLPPAPVRRTGSAMLREIAPRCDTRYFDEAALPPLSRADGAADTTFLAAELSAARTAEERIRMIRGVLHIVGFRGLGYAALKLNAQAQAERAYLLRDYLASDLLPKALEGGYFLRDPQMRRALDSSRLHVWDIRSILDASRNDALDSQVRRHFDELRAHGLASGLAFGLPISQTPMRAIIVFAGAPEHCEWITDSVIAQAIGLGLSLHQRCSAYIQAMCRREATNGLSELQQRILSAVVAGLSDKAIAARFDTTVHNVDYHLRQLREKLGARNRSQLAYLAGRLQAA
ncbi:hypothetical protein GWC77_17290 [Paraburkholderia sp. NMBU_R16]|uniref:helix-turn-helix transcriptional regulator n=1 Tax=Paraburkholderia sp. NMBU_R16 TaxID=2698676 RepID=UPI0015657544|nr:LuxR family transcriptional regulator [Paraburkholderia sp. NMBU_R16]NRO97677.1 hypothetical protein [Paraburkholderia sp. NMBU_R16]